MPKATLSDLAATGNLAALKNAGRAHAARIRMAVQNADERAREIIEGRIFVVLSILDATDDSVTAAACVKELEQARAEVDSMLGQTPRRKVGPRPMQQVVGAAGMGAAPEGDELEAIRAANRASLGMGAPISASAADIASNLFNATVRGVTLRTTVTPEMRYAPGAPGQPAQVENASGGAGEFILGLLKPEVDIETPGGSVTLAPYGKPESNYFWPMVGIVVVGFATVGYFALEGVKSKVKRLR